uniref:Uncharacterized protein n=1 Tax=Guillardia theta TaxID=55529 RepID=A0A7S4KMK4_GUITH|mmetsp:Transcript_27306/g.89147  ORF Transcript_27306/g.89147 Transcript_27306/m.89147 type:complete len:382 (+) Transcript_27306:41-1186(+)
MAKGKRTESPLDAQRRATEEQRTAMNLTVLQRMDPEVMEVLEMSRHVVLYAFDCAGQSWSKLDVEGSMFVVRKRRAFSCIILNRSGLENFVQDIGTYTMVQIEGPYLMCTNSTNNQVLGFWFYKEEETIKIGKLFNDLVEICKGGFPVEQSQAKGYGAVEQNLKSILGIAPVDTGPAASDRATEDLKGLLGISEGPQHSEAKAGALPPEKPSVARPLETPFAIPAKLDAGAEIMKMINAGKEREPLPPTRGPPLVDTPVPSSPGSEILAMLRNSFPAPAAPAAADVTDSSSAAPHAASSFPRQETASSSAAAILPDPSIPTMTPASLLRQSVQRTRKADFVMTKDQFKRALEDAVKDDAFVSELYEQYLNPTRGQGETRNH